MGKLDFFDVNCMIGSYSTCCTETFFTAETILKELDYYGISEALVFHSLAKNYSPHDGNNRLLQEIKCKRLYPCWVIIPAYSQEITHHDKLIPQIIKEKVKAVRMFPVFHNFSLNILIDNGLFQALENQSVPVLIDFDIQHWKDNSIDWNVLYQLCQSYPRLSFILVRAGFGFNRNIYALLHEFSNVYIEISYYCVSGGIEDICRKFGASRLIYGSGMPVYAAGPVISMVTYANITFEEKKMIAGGNIRKILKEAEYS